MKLYLVVLRGFGGWCSGIDYKSSYVVAEDMDTAYKKVKEFLDKKDYGYSGDREVLEVKLIADTSEYNNTKTRLFL